jgi:DNA-binding transcriptional LysR family regulator
MNYTLHQLQVFAKVVQTNSITKASEELFMTQPAVSIQLKNFQDQFDIPLTEIIGRQIKITDFGFEIYEMIEKIISEVHAINYKTLSFKGLLSGRLKIGVVSTGKYVMPYLLTDFIKENQGIELTMDVTNKMKVIESLSKGEIDFALVSILPDKLNIHEEIILDNELYFVANNKFKIDKQKLTKEELEKHALIFREEGSATRKVMEDYFEKKNIRASKKIELTSNEAVKQAVIAGLGISIMPLIGIRSEIKNKRLKIIPSSGLPIKTKWRLIWLKNKSLSPVATSYINYLKENKNKLVSNYF